MLMDELHKMIRRRIICSIYGHSWQGEYDEHNSFTGRRQCSRCELHQKLFVKRFPGIGEPTYQWKDMYD